MERPRVLVNKCCRPLHKHNIRKTCTRLQNLSQADAAKIIEITGVNPKTSKICKNCQSHLHWKYLRTCQRPTNESEPNEVPINGYAVLEPHIEIMEFENMDEDFAPDFSDNVAKLNVLLQFIGTDKCNPNIYKSPFNERMKEAERICNNICSKILNIEKIYKYDAETHKESQHFKEMVDQLKEKYTSSTSTKLEKFQTLTVLPKSWTTHQIVDMFPDVTTYNAQKMKETVGQHGILATLPKVIRTKNNYLNEEITKFYNSDQISREMPGMNDMIRITKEGDKVTKRLMIYTVNEAYDIFKTEKAELKVSISKFYSLRPKQCVLPNSNGTHKVCLCAIHQNFELLLKAIKSIHHNSEFNSFDESTFVKNILCPEPNIQCYLRKCIKCNDICVFKQHLQVILRDNCGEQITFKQWMSTDRCDLEVVLKPIDEFLDYFISKLEKFVFHQYVARKQSEYLKSRKNNLKIGEVLVIGDFSENFSFLHANEVQSFHWTNKQCTIHPFVLYFLDGSYTLQHKSFTIISNDLRHDSTAVYLFLKRLMKFIKRNVNPNPTNIIYFSDGAGSQYKNKNNFVNLRFHEEDFGMKAEWHFFATSHGKGACDGVGGTIKRMARDEVLRKGCDNEIVDSGTLYKWLLAKKSEGKIILNVAHTTIKDYDNTVKKLNIRFAKYTPLAVKETHKCHSFIPSANNKAFIDVRYCSDDNDCVRSTKIFK